MSAPPAAFERGDGLENEGIRQKRSIKRSPFNSRVDKIGLQSRMISQPWCRAELHGDHLVGNQITRLSSCDMLILSEFLSPNFDLNSSNVLRGWISHGDVAVVWLTQPLTSSTAPSLLKTRHQAYVVGFYTKPVHFTVSQSFERFFVMNMNGDVEDSSFRVLSSCMSRFRPLCIQQRSQSSRWMLVVQNNAILSRTQLGNTCREWYWPLRLLEHWRFWQVVVADFCHVARILEAERALDL